ncbi:polysaccharide deacetylase family protein [Nocardiopsis baichengensis]|uniref:polysaccharide deacetylase family protein n=1 Tax=Nocardiopsis baichengensis TaxID=280240 RepID=UPI0019554668|nr:polysaccharide deacetylase family protein [Nocardiopsis baichengensis]
MSGSAPREGRTILYAGISWTGTGHRVEVVDADGGEARPPAEFDASRTTDLIACLSGLDALRFTVVESTNGILDGRLMAAGLEVYRADPGVLPARPAFGAVPAAALTRAARYDRGRLTRLERRRGTQTGREDELEAWIASSADADRDAAAAGRFLFHGPRDRPDVALTFDDGPLPPYTGQVLDVLDRYGVPATFFCVGMTALAHPEELVRMREGGHALGNHTWSHPFLPELSGQELREQFGRTGASVAEASGGPPPSLFRPPYGARTPEVVGRLQRLRATTVLWDVAPDDWTMPGSETIARTVLDGVQPGSVVLLHDGGGDRSETVAALPPIIEGLLERGYRFVTVDTLASTTARSASKEPAGAPS